MTPLPGYLAKNLRFIRKGLDEALDHVDLEHLSHAVAIASAQLNAQAEMLEMGLQEVGVPNETDKDR